MKKARILIVDDDVPLTQSIKLNLEDSERYVVRVENSSLKALDAAIDFEPDLILLDIVMPDLDGGDVSALIKANPKLSRVPILMVTALVSNDETGQDSSVARGEHVMVAKPIRFDKLVEAIENQLTSDV